MAAYHFTTLNPILGVVNLDYDETLAQGQGSLGRSWSGAQRPFGLLQLRTSAGDKSRMGGNTLSSALPRGETLEHPSPKLPSAWGPGSAGKSPSVKNGTLK